MIYTQSAHGVWTNRVSSIAAYSFLVLREELLYGMTYEYLEAIYSGRQH